MYFMNLYLENVTTIDKSSENTWAKVTGRVERESAIVAKGETDGTNA